MNAMSYIHRQQNSCKIGSCSKSAIRKTPNEYIYKRRGNMRKKQKQFMPQIKSDGMEGFYENTKTISIIQYYFCYLL